MLGIWPRLTGFSILDASCVLLYLVFTIVWGNIILALISPGTDRESCSVIWSPDSILLQSVVTNQLTTVIVYKLGKEDLPYKILKCTIKCSMFIKHTYSTKHTLWSIAFSYTQISRLQQRGMKNLHIRKLTYEKVVFQLSGDDDLKKSCCYKFLLILKKKLDFYTNNSM